MNAHLGELIFTDHLSSKVIYPFSFIGEIEGQDNERYCYGEIMVPPNFEERYANELEIHVFIPYIPVYKILCVRFRFDINNGQTQYLINRRNNRIYFSVISDADRFVPLSTYLQFNPDGYYKLVFRDGNLIVYSGAESDVLVKPSLKQTETFLLKSFASNMYQHPETGVGLIDFLHGNFAVSGLPEKLLSEFKADKMNVNNANMDSDSGEMYLDITEYE